MIHITMCMLSGIQRDEIPEIVVRGLRLRKAAVGLLLGGMDEVGELDRVLDEEDRDVVADEVPVAFLGVELDREAAHVARQIGRALVAGDGREAHEDRRLLAGALEQIGAGDVGERLVILEIAMRADSRGHARRAPGMRSWSKWKIFSRKWKSSSAVGPRRPIFSEFWSSATGIALLRRQDRHVAAGDLMGLAALAADNRLFA